MALSAALQKGLPTTKKSFAKFVSSSPAWSSWLSRNGGLLGLERRRLRTQASTARQLCSPAANLPRGRSPALTSPIPVAKLTAIVKKGRPAPAALRDERRNACRGARVL